MLEIWEEISNIGHWIEHGGEILENQALDSAWRSNVGESGNELDCPLKMNSKYWVLDSAH
jgi:hypothetical protein